MKTEEEVRKILQEKISDFDKIIEKLDSLDDDVVPEMYEVADQLEGAIDVLKEILEIKE